MVLGLFVTAVSAADPDRELSRQAIAILKRECIACHGAEKQEGGLRLDSRSFLVSGGDNGSALPPSGSPSLLVDRIEHADPELSMPPKRPLGAFEVSTIKKWIESGAPWELSLPLEATSKSDVTVGDAFVDPNNPIRKLFDGKRLELWSLKPIERSSLPSVIHQDWCANPIDYFVLSEWEKKGVAPADPISDRNWLRRTALDTTGLPPAYADIERFLADSNADKYRMWVERQLTSPSFGVHWARTWLDVIRYSDSNGFDWDEYRPDAWRYRDYVIRALNNDKPYDQFILEQLAGDELVGGPPRTTEEQDAWIATGYLRMGPQDNAASLFNEQDRARAELMSDLTETTGSALLGLTFSCCRCHDHKSDPLSQEDHYRFRAFFAACQIPAEPYLDLDADQRAIREHNAEFDGRIQSNKETIATLKKSVQARHASKVTDKKLLELMTKEERETLQKLEADNKSLTKQKRSFTQGLLMTDVPQKAEETYVFYQGDHRSPKQKVEPGFPSVLFPNAIRMVPPATDKTTGRRLTLAKWVTSKQNPWTARVIVNRIWQGYFGRGLVATPNDFGVTGAQPSHPKLLDYLASELMENGWSLKHIHRLILNSSTYRQQAMPADIQLRLHRGALRSELRRLSAEQLRDSLLAASGLLQEQAGGPAVWPEVDPQTLAANPAVLDDNETKTKGWYPSPASSQSVRSLYLIQKRTIRIPWLETFDLPENAVSCGRRETSIVAPQSLTLMNGALTAQAASLLNEQVQRMGFTQPCDVINYLFESVLLRKPNSQEMEFSQGFLRSRTPTELSMVLLNCNEFAFYE
jgi:hypothetical protein